MEISQESFVKAAQRANLESSAAQTLWQELLKEPQQSSKKSPLVNFILYFGACLVIFAMGVLMINGDLWWQGPGYMWLSAIYAVIFVTTGTLLWQKTEYRMAGGLLITLAVFMAPLFVLGLKMYLGEVPDTRYAFFFDLFQTSEKSTRLFMELATIAAGVVALIFFRFPFLTFPISLALWFLSGTLADYLWEEGWVSYDREFLTSLWSGLAMMVVAFLIDQRTRKDYSFWLYLFGLVAFSWGLLILFDNTAQWVKFGYFATNFVLILISFLLDRRVFLVFGAIGIFTYLCYLSFNLFSNWAVFSIVMSLIGLIFISLGIFYQRYERRIQALILMLLPSRMKSWMPIRRK